MSYRIVECQTRCLFLYLTESFAYGMAVVGRSSGAVGRAELGEAFRALGSHSALCPGCYTWDLEQLLLFQPSPAGWFTGWLCQGQAPAGFGPGRVVRQGHRDGLRHPPCSGAVGAPRPPQALKSSPSVLLSGDKSMSAPWLDRGSGCTWKTWNLLHPQSQLQG